MKAKVRKLDYMGTPTNHWFEFKSQDETQEILIEIGWVSTDERDKKSLPYLWRKHGWTDRVINNYLVCNTYVYSKEGCVSKYNPTHTKDHKIDFDWLLEATAENEQKIIDEIVNRVFKEEQKTWAIEQ